MSNSGETDGEEQGHGGNWEKKGLLSTSAASLQGNREREKKGQQKQFLMRKSMKGLKGQNINKVLD